MEQQSTQQLLTYNSTVYSTCINFLGLHIKQTSAASCLTRVKDVTADGSEVYKVLIFTVSLKSWSQMCTNQL